MSRLVLITAFLCLHVAGALASEVAGKITVAPRMVEKSLPAAIYDLRGTAVSMKTRPVSDAKFGRVAVWLENSEAANSPPTTASMEQQGARFEPDLLMVPVGSKVSFPNLDPVFHNIFSLSKAQAFDLGYYPQGKTREVVFSRPGIVQVYCHIHPEMYGVVVVTSSRWMARPARDGSFGWRDVPPGKYVLAVWQRSAGLVHKPVIVPESGVVEVVVNLPEEGAGR